MLDASGIECVQLCTTNQAMVLADGTTNDFSRSGAISGQDLYDSKETGWWACVASNKYM